MSDATTYTAEQIEKAKYDLATLPTRQAMVRHMIREPWQSVEAVAILRKEYAANARRIETAKSLLPAR